ncbi:MAG: hypothetical protein AAFQ76_05045 [Cyanobacteria bacterium J06626_26]
MHTAFETVAEIATVLFLQLSLIHPRILATLLLRLSSGSVTQIQPAHLLRHT